MISPTPVIGVIDLQAQSGRKVGAGLPLGALHSALVKHKTKQTNKQKLRWPIPPGSVEEFIACDVGYLIYEYIEACVFVSKSGSTTAELLRGEAALPGQYF